MGDASQIFAGQPEGFVVEAAATAPIAGPAQVRSWLDAKHDEFTRKYHRWKLVSDFYHGNVIEDDVARQYLMRRYQGEPDQAYAERVKIADFTPHLATLIDTLAGMLFAVEDRASRVWTKADAKSGDGGGLGDPNTPGTDAHRLWSDADGEETGWPTLWRQFVIDLISYQYMWVLIDTKDGEPVVKLVSPTQVPNWLDDYSEVMMKEQVDTRTSLQETEDAQRATPQRFVLWKLGGWERWERQPDGTPRQLPGAEGSGAYSYVSHAGAPCPPIFRVDLPIRRYVAWILANKAKVIFNQESVRDFGLRTANFAKLVLGVASSEQLEKMEQRLLKGMNIIPEDKEASGTHRYIHAPAEPITIATTILDKKIEHLWVSGFRMYADAAREKTATEIRQDVAAGVGAFLQLLKAAVDDAENGAFWLLEQATRSQTPDAWGVAHVERSDDFSNTDTNAIMDQLRARYLGTGNPIPVGRSALIQLAKDSARSDGLPVNDAEIINAIDTQELQSLLSTIEALGCVPAIVKARLVIKAISTLGLIDPTETATMADGSKQNLLALLLTQATDLATANEEAQRRMSELAPPNAGPPKEKPEPDPNDKSKLGLNAAGT